MQAALLSNDPYARRLAQWFTKLDGLDALKRPGRPPDQDQQVQDERLKALRAIAHSNAVKRWESDYFLPWKQRFDAHNKAKRATYLFACMGYPQKA